MPTQQELNDRFVATYWREVGKNLAPEVAYPYAVLDAYLWAYTGRGAPQIISGYRSPAEQRALFWRWQAGDNSLTTKPARQSWHMAGRAIDVRKNDANFETFAQWWKQWYGDAVRDGRTFGDAGHFDVPGDHLPDPAF